MLGSNFTSTLLFFSFFIFYYVLVYTSYALPLTDLPIVSSSSEFLCGKYSRNSLLLLFLFEFPLILHSATLSFKLKVSNFSLISAFFFCLIFYNLPLTAEISSPNFCVLFIRFRKYHVLLPIVL